MDVLRRDAESGAGRPPEEMTEESPLRKAASVLRCEQDRGVAAVPLSDDV